MRITTNDELVLYLSGLPGDATVNLWVGSEEKPLKQIYFNHTDNQVHLSEEPHTEIKQHPEGTWWEDGPVFHFVVKDEKEEEENGLNATELLDYAEKGLKAEIEQLDSLRKELLQGTKVGPDGELVQDEIDHQHLGIVVRKHVKASQQLIQLRQKRKAGMEV